MTYEFTDKKSAQVKARIARSQRRAQTIDAISQGNFFTWDGGRNKITLLPADGTKPEHAIEVTKADFIKLDIPGLEPGMVLVGEEAHHRARNILSLSHVFEYEELLELEKNAKEKGIILVMFNQDISQLARHAASGTYQQFKDSDAYDCFCIKNYLLTKPKLCTNQLREFKPVKTEDHQSRIDFIHEARRAYNQDILICKKKKYEDEDNGILDFLDEHIKDLMAVLDEDERALLGMKIVNAGKSIARGDTRDERLDFNISRVYMILATLLKRDGSLRIRLDTGKVPHWKYISDTLFGIQASHRKAGCGASAYKYDMRVSVSRFTMLFEDGTEEWQERRKQYVAEENAKKAKNKKATSLDPHLGRVRMHTHLKEEAEERFRFARAEVDKSLRSIWRKFRQVVLEVYQSELG